MEKAVEIEVKVHKECSYIGFQTENTVTYPKIFTQFDQKMSLCEPAPLCQRILLFSVAYFSLC